MGRNRASSAPPDADLVAACRDGDARAWRELVHRYRRLVYGIPFSLGLQAADADDVFQQTFAELLRSLPRLRQPDRLEAWLVTATRRAALRLRRDERRRRTLAERHVADTAPAATAAAADREIERLREGERVARELEALGEPCRGLLSAMFSEPSPTYRALAERFGLAVGSLGPTRARCLQRLRNRLLRGAGPLSPGGLVPGGRSGGRR